MGAQKYYTKAQLQEWSKRLGNEAPCTSLIQEQFTILLASENQIIAFAISTSFMSVWINKVKDTESNYIWTS